MPSKACLLYTSGIRGKRTFLYDCRVSEAKNGISLSFFGRHTRRNVVFHPHFDVRLEFSIDLLLHFGASEQIRDTAKELSLIHI